MGVLINKYSWVLNLLTITVCAFLAAKTVSHLVEANLPQMKRQAGRLPPPDLTGALARNNPGREIAAILKRNIFCSTCKTDTEAATAAAAPPADAPQALRDGKAVKTTLNLRLIATLTSEEAGNDGNYASILDMTSNRVQLYAIGAKVPGDGLITDILDRYVLLQANQRREYLALETGAGGPDSPGGITTPPPPTRYNAPKALPGLEGIAKGIKQVGRVRWEVSQGIIGQVLSNKTLLGRGARVIPVMKNGKAAGFRFFGRKGSVASLMGLYGGDTIKSINGQSVLSPDQALEVVTKLRTASYLTLTFNRKGQELTHEYVVR
jgi:general secretion pathway protein C